MTVTAERFRGFSHNEWSSEEFVWRLEHFSDARQAAGVRSRMV